MASVACRKSMGVRFEDTTSPNSFISSPRRRSIAVPKASSMIGENDDEAEILARRERLETGSPATATPKNTNRRQSLGLSSIAHMSAPEITNQISQCIKLSAENKINNKNAFQLKIIDCLEYTLKTQDGAATDLQVASTCLDVSAKIYGFRVDRVHSDLLKIVGGIGKRTDKETAAPEEGEGEKSCDATIQKEKERGKKKKKRSREHIVASEEALRGTVETYDPMELMKTAMETQTSDMLYQARMPIHANQGLWPNLEDDVILDEALPANEEAAQGTNTNMLEIMRIEHFKDREICPSFRNFKFLGWSPENDVQAESAAQEACGASNTSAYQFDLDASLPADDDEMPRHEFDDHGDDLEVRVERLRRDEPMENVIDLQDIIVKSTDTRSSLEYGYIEKNMSIRWAGPSYWKIVHNRNLASSRIDEACKHAPAGAAQARKKKEINLNFAKESWDPVLAQIGQLDKNSKLQPRTVKFHWSDVKLLFPPDVCYPIKQFCNYFYRPEEFLDLSIAHGPSSSELDDDQLERYDYNNEHDVSNYCPDLDKDNDELSEARAGRLSGDTQPGCSGWPLDETSASNHLDSQGAFVGDNLVAAPRLTDKIFVPYSQRAKKVDMRQLKKAMWETLKISNTDKEKEKEKENLSDTQTPRTKLVRNTTMGNICKALPKFLSKSNAEALSAPLAFVSLLHLANERNLTIESLSDLSDLLVQQDDGVSHSCGQQDQWRKEDTPVL